MTTSSQSEPRVFISYARKDGAEAALSLHDSLRAAGCDAWLDRAEIRGGASWSKEIEAALDNCDVLVAMLTPASYVSEICRAEQLWALDEGKLVIPVLAAADATVPIHLTSRNWRKYPEEQTQLLEDILNRPPAIAPAPRPLRYDTVPNLPQNHLVREKPLADLRNLVFTEGSGANIAVTALAGMGGIGKTVLATALCRDPVVQRAFPDGIAWIAIGREWDEDFITRMREVARALGDDLSGYDNPLACENRYRTLLREKAALVVVDDVWSVEHLKPLLVDAPRSRFLFTTRDAGIARAVTDRKYSANLLSHSEARDLLSRWAGKEVHSLPPEASGIIRECGELAAAVAQIGAGLRDLSLLEWRDTLEALQRADIRAIEDRLPSGQQSFFKSLAVSIQALPGQMQQRYLTLAVLLEDVPAPLVVLQTLWRVTEAEARRTARNFVDRSLASWESQFELSRGIRLHDLQLDYVRARFGDPAALLLIHGALRLSAHVIAQRPEEFASQIVGRLRPYEENAAIVHFTKQVAEGAPKPWLKPIWPSLRPPGTGLIRTLVGHVSGLSGVAVTAHGRVVSSSDDGTLKIWDLASGRELHTLAGHADRVNGAAVTADRRCVISASADKTLKVWDLARGQRLRTLEGHSSGVRGVAVTVDGRLAVSASEDETLKVWDLTSGREVRTLRGHSNWVNGVALTTDGRYAVSASDDKTLKVWDLASGEEQRSLEGHFSGVRGVAVTHDGQYVISASADKTLKIWDLASGLEVRTLTGHSSYVYAVTATADGRYAVSASADKTLRVWDLASGLRVGALVGHADRVRGVAVTADGRRAVSASDDGTLKVWDLASGQEVRPLSGHPAAVSQVAVTTDGRLAVSASSDNTLKIWDLADGREVRSLTGHSGAVRGVAVTMDGRRAVSGSNDRSLKVWDLLGGQCLLTLTGHSAGVNEVALTPNGQHAVSASRDNTLKLWDLASGEEVRTLEGHSYEVWGVAITPDGQRAVSASRDNTLRVWNLSTGEHVHTLAGHSAAVRDVAITADGLYALSGSLDKTLKLWDLASGQEVRTLEIHAAPIRGVAVTGDGRRAVSLSYDNTVKVVDLDDGAVIAGFTCDSAARCCALSGPNEILAGDAAGRLYFLRLELK